MNALTPNHPDNLLLRLLTEAMGNAARNPQSWRSTLPFVEEKFRDSLLAWRAHYGDVVGDITFSHHVNDPVVRNALNADLLSNLDAVIEDSWFARGRIMDALPYDEEDAR